MQFRSIVFAGMTVVAASSAASFAQAAKGADPADPGAPTPTARYESAFAGYAAYQEPQAGNWRERNDELGSVGGHAGHLQRPDQAPGTADDAGIHKH
jgi:hypothetical protein